MFFVLLVQAVALTHVRYSLSEESLDFCKNFIKDGQFDNSEVMAAEIIDNSWRNYFYLNHQFLVLKKKLDREAICPQCSYGSFDSCRISFTISITLKSHIRFVEIEVIINDVNDNAPVFSENYIEYNMSSGAKVGDTISLERATDADGGNYSVQGYRLESDKEIPFELTYDVGARPSVYLTVTGELLQREYNFNLVTSDGEHEAKLKVQINSIQDKPSVIRFMRESDSVFVREDTPVGTVVYKPKTHTATDESGARYSFGGQSTDREGYFTIDEYTGFVHLARGVNHEEHSEFIVTISVCSSSDQVDKMTLRVYVIDVNNNSPEMQIISVSSRIQRTQNDSFSIRENIKTPQILFYLTVHDNDVGENGRTSCDLADNAFVVAKQITFNLYSLVLINQLDYERLRAFDATMVCRDHGSPPTSGRRRFLFHVTDLNDNSPVFFRPHYEAVLWTSQPGITSCPVLNVRAFDEDSGVNSVISYSIPNQADLPFLIDRGNGSIFVSRVPKANQRHTFTVTATDHGIPPLQTNVSVDIISVAENLHVPRFERADYHFSVLDNCSAGQLVGQVTAQDDDFSGNVSLLYFWDPLSDCSQFFTIGKRGEIYTNFNFRDFKTRECRLLVSDGGYPQSFESETRATVELKRSHQLLPRFIFPGEEWLTVELEGGEGHPMSCIAYLFPEKDPTSRHFYSFFIKNSNLKNTYLSLTPDGELYASGESTANASGLYWLEIVAMDRRNGTRRLFFNVRVELAAAKKHALLKNRVLNITIALSLVGLSIAIFIGGIVGSKMFKKARGIF